jgi:hypothetical protein
MEVLQLMIEMIQRRERQASSNAAEAAHSPAAANSTGAASGTNAGSEANMVMQLVMELMQVLMALLENSAGSHSQFGNMDPVGLPMASQGSSAAFPNAY